MHIEITNADATHTAIDESDEFLRLMLKEAELPSLLPALAQATGDKRLIAHHLRPPLAVSPTVPTQGGMSEEMQGEARELALEALIRLRDQGPTPTDLDEGTLTELLEFITGPVDSDYVPMLRHELGVPPGIGAPSWSIPSEGDAGRDFAVLVIGAGMSGLAVAHRLQQTGVNLVVLEKNDDVGGTWLENIYPGCRLDTNNFGYSYSFAQTPEWRWQYSAQDSILQYFQTVAERLDLRDVIQFGTTVESMKWDEDTATWTVKATGPDGPVEYRANAVVSAVGQLNKPSIPDIEGAESFGGEAWHTATWRSDVDLRGKRIAVVGTGASAFQVVPEMAAVGSRVKVFQRTPPWMLPAPDYKQPVKSEMSWLLRHVPYYHRWYRFFQFWATVEGRRPYVQVDPSWQHPVSVSEKNEELRQIVQAYIETEFSDRPDLLPHVIPSYPPGAKRMLRDDGSWAKALHSDHVDLVTESISHIEPEGIRTADGTLHEVDYIVYGTGFKASGFLEPMQVTGRNNLDLHEQWDGDARAYLGVTVPNFPNLFMLYGPNTNLVVNGSIILMSECSADYTLSCLKHLLENNASALEVRQDVFQDFNDEIDAANDLMAWGASGVNSWYKNASGRVSQNWPHSLLDYFVRTRAMNPSEYDVTTIGKDN